MKRIRNYLILLVGLFSVVCCSTEDVNFIEDKPDKANFYLLSDIAFAEYLIYNTTLPATNINALPYGICIHRNDSFLLDIDKAINVKQIYLVKDSKRIEALEAAGVASAAVKIKNLDGIQFFRGCTNLKITSNAVEGKLDLSSLSKLDTLEMNANLVNQLIVPSSIMRLRYSASTNATDQERLTEINLRNASKAQHIYLPNHLITQTGLVLPLSYPNLTDLDLAGNAGAPFEIPLALFNQLVIKNGVIAEEDKGEEPTDKNYLIKDRAFADYLFYLMNDEKDQSLRLPEGLVSKTENQVFLNKEIAAGFTGTLNISKASSYITKLQEAGVSTADTKIADADGLQFFTSLTELIATSNAFTAELPISDLLQLERLIVRTAGVSKIDLSTNINLLYLDLQGSTSKSLNRLKGIDLRNNLKLNYVNLSANEIDPDDFHLSTAYADLRTLNMGKNKVNNSEVSYLISSSLYDQLGNESADKAGLVRGE